MRALAVSFVLAAAACGNIGQANIDACNAFVASATCGGLDLASRYDCSQFDSATCDVTQYFTCLKMHYVCVNGQYDGAAAATVSQCDPYVTCR